MEKSKMNLWFISLKEKQKRFVGSLYKHIQAGNKLYKYCIMLCILISAQCLQSNNRLLNAITQTCNENNLEQISTLHTQADLSHEAKKVVVLDAGHGGYDPGSSSNGYLEKELTLDIVKALGEKLTQENIEVIYTREDDERNFNQVEDDLNQRVQIGNETKADLFISIHLNEHDEDSSGIETWVSFQDEPSYIFAEMVQAHLSNLAYSNNRGLKNQDEALLHVLSHNQRPAVLIELGFISSKADMAYITNPSTQTHITDAIVASIKAYWQA